MPTTEELYQKHIAPGKREKDALRHTRSMAREGSVVRARAKTPVCKHYLKGEWTVHTTESGVKMGKCGGCNCGFPLNDND